MRFAKRKLAVGLRGNNEALLFTMFSAGVNFVNMEFAAVLREVLRSLLAVNESAKYSGCQFG